MYISSYGRKYLFVTSPASIAYQVKDSRVKEAILDIARRFNEQDAKIYIASNFCEVRNGDLFLLPHLCDGEVKVAISA